jgi:hypothetical protein
MDKVTDSWRAAAVGVRQLRYATSVRVWVWVDEDVLSLGVKSKKEVADAMFSFLAEEFQKYRIVCVGRTGGVMTLQLEGRRDAETETAR